MPDAKLARTLKGFEQLLAAATALARQKSPQPALLQEYDRASGRLIEGLRGNGISEEALQSIHKAVARLRLALEQLSP